MKTTHILKILNGKGGDYPDSWFNPEILEMGIQVELEHTSRRDVAKIIAKQHVVELGNGYYPRLLEMEAELKREKELARLLGR